MTDEERIIGRIINQSLPQDEYETLELIQEHHTEVDEEVVPILLKYQHSLFKVRNMFSADDIPLFFDTA